MTRTRFRATTSLIAMGLKTKRIPTVNRTTEAMTAIPPRSTTQSMIPPSLTALPPRHVSTSKIKHLLDRWEEPISKTDKVSVDVTSKHRTLEFIVIYYTLTFHSQRRLRPRFRIFSSSAKPYRTWTIHILSRYCLALRRQEMNVFGRH